MKKLTWPWECDEKDREGEEREDGRVGDGGGRGQHADGDRRHEVRLEETGGVGALAGALLERGHGEGRAEGQLVDELRDAVGEHVDDEQLHGPGHVVEEAAHGRRGRARVHVRRHQRQQQVQDAHLQYSAGRGICPISE